ncbi:MAG: site-specific DNA-methyltransferase [Chloracidobacterium sp.]|nr:site-specific DNA-methyltransferase [Chloracidobacterium sp.]
MKKYLVGDAFNLIKELPDESIDLILTSPPYWGLRTYGQEHNWATLRAWEKEKPRWESPSYKWYREHGGVLGLEPLPDWFISHLVEFFELSKPKLKAGGSLWVNLGDTYFARWSSIRDAGRQGLGSDIRTRRTTPMGRYLQEKQLLLIPSRFAIAMQEAKWILRNDLIWSKPNIPPGPKRDRLRLSHEHFFHFVKKPKEGRAAYYYDVDEAEADLDVVICNVRPGQNGHSATFPREIIAPRISSSCPEFGTMLDPFCGSGASVEAAASLGRNAIGFEIVEKFLPRETRYATG